MNGDAIWHLSTRRDPTHPDTDHTWRSLEDTELGEISQLQKDRSSRIPLVRGSPGSPRGGLGPGLGPGAGVSRGHCQFARMKHPVMVVVQCECASWLYAMYISSQFKLKKKTYPRPLGSALAKRHIWMSKDICQFGSRATFLEGSDPVLFGGVPLASSPPHPPPPVP